MSSAREFRPSEPHLSVVAVSRNDDHGGDLQWRMQRFIDGFVAQCRRHKLNAELILVEWNPPADRATLREALQWPKAMEPAQIRIITVPAELHQTLPHADDLPLFQMIGKNVGIRRARGRYVLVTNVDILFDDNVVIYLRDRLRSGILVRLDRYDVHPDLTKICRFDQLLARCRISFLRVNTRFGTFDAQSRQFITMANSVEARILALYSSIRVFGFANSIRHATGSSFRPQRQQTGVGTIRKWVRFLRSVFSPRRIAKRWYILGLPLPTASPAKARFAASHRLHTNGCGDFTLLAREDWLRLRGYPEWPMFSWHLDSVLLFAANAQGIKQVRLGPRYRIFHLDHSMGSGWSPEGARELFARLNRKQIPYLSNDAILKIQKDYAESPALAIANDLSWGLADVVLPECEISSPITSPRQNTISLESEYQQPTTKVS